MSITWMYFNTLKTFRQQIYGSFERGADALFTLCDALLSESQAPCIERRWSSLYQGLTNGKINEATLQAVTIEALLHERAAEAPICISVDSSSVPQDEALQAKEVRLPRSTRTIWRILDAAGAIERDPPRQRSPRLPRAPLEEVQLDFKDVSTVPVDLHDPDAKRQHVIEACNFVDAGTSILLDAQVHEDFHAETAFQAVVAFLRRYGCPSILTFDRDPRWVGSATARDFPSALCQFLLSVGVQPNILPPRHPELNCMSKGIIGPTCQGRWNDEPIWNWPPRENELQRTIIDECRRTNADRTGPAIR